MLDYGAAGDGRTDDTAALRHAVADLNVGQPLTFPSGHTFLHSDVLTVTVAGAHLTGGGTLVATDEARSALQIEADRVLVDGLRLTTPHTTQRWSSPDQHKVVLGGHAGIVLRNVAITGSAAAGVFCYGASDFVLDAVSVSDTRADGIHMTNGSHSGTVTSPRISRSGDDAVAVVSYLSDGAVCHDITVASPRVRTTTGGRGLSVVGGRTVSYTDIDVDGTAAAGVYLACEGDPYNTFPTEDVHVLGGSVTHANEDTSIDHGAVLVYSGRNGGSVSDVTLSGLSVSGTRPTASRQVGVVVDAGTTSAVTFSDFHLQSGPVPFASKAPVGDYSTSGWTLDGQPYVVVP